MKKRNEEQGRLTAAYRALRMLSNPVVGGEQFAPAANRSLATWAIFLSCDVPSGEQVAMRTSMKKLHDARRRDKQDVYRDGRCLTARDLHKAGKHWHKFRFQDDGPDWLNASIRYRLVLWSSGEVVGFCTFHVDFSHSGEEFEHEMDGTLALDSVFIEPVGRGVGLSSRIAEEIVDILTRHLRDLDNCLKRAGAVQPCGLQLTVESHAISDGGERFVENVKLLVEQATLEEFPCLAVGDSLLTVEFLGEDEAELPWWQAAQID